MSDEKYDPRKSSHVGIHGSLEEKRRHYQTTVPELAEMRARVRAAAVEADERMSRQQALELLGVSVDAMKAIPLPPVVDPLVDGLLDGVRKAVEEHYRDEE